MIPLNEHLQNLINSLHEGRGREILRIGVAILMAVCVFALYAFNQFRGLSDPSAMEAGQLAHSLATGQGMTTRCVRPADLGILSRHNETLTAEGRYPDIRQAPLYPMLLSIPMRMAPRVLSAPPDANVFPLETMIVVPFGVACSIVTGILILMLGMRLFDRRTAVVGVVIYFVTDTALAASISGTVAPLLTMLTTAALYMAHVAVVHRGEQVSFARWFVPWVACAVICGLLVLAGYAMAVIIPAVTLFLLTGLTDRSLPGLLTLAAVIAILVGPWLVRNKVVCGRLFGSAPATVLSDSILHSEDTFDRSTESEFRSFRVAHALRVKLATNLGRSFDGNLRTLGNGLIMSFFLVSFFRRFGRQDVNLMRWCVGLGLVLLVAVDALRDQRAPPLLGVFLPMVILYGTACLFDILERMESFGYEMQAVLTGAVVMLSAMTAVLRLVGPPADLPYPPVFPPFASYVCGLLEPNEILCTDIPWATAWYGRRTSILLPRSTEEFSHINTNYVRTSGLYLTQETGNRAYTDGLAKGPYRSWLPLLQAPPRVPDGFPFTNAIALPPGTRDQLFLTDRARWSPGAEADLAEESSDVSIRPGPADET